MKPPRKIIILFLVIFLPYIISTLFYGQIYNFIYTHSLSGLFSDYFLFGELLLIYSLLYIFFDTLLFTAFGTDNKYYWMIASLGPAILFGALDWLHIYILIAIGLAGWVIGYVISGFITKENPSLEPRSSMSSEIKLLKNFCLIGIAWFVSYTLSEWLGYKLSKVINISGGYLDFSSLWALVIAYMVLAVFLFTAFGDRYKYWWIGISISPAVIFEIFFDWQHILIPIVSGLVAWILGYGVSKIPTIFKLRSRKT